MTPTRAQLESYNAQPLQDISTGLTQLCPKIEALFERYVNTVTAPGWQGKAAEAVHLRAVGDRKTAYSLVDAVEAAAKRLGQGYYDLNTPLANTRNLIASAEAAGFVVAQSILSVSIAPGREVTPELESARADWENRIIAAANVVEAEDQRLQQELATLGKSMLAEFAKIARSQTTINEKRFTDAERWIFDEMKRNVDSDIVSMMRALLVPSGEGNPVKAVLSMWNDQVKSGAAWDHKPQLKQRYGLKDDPDFYFQQPGTHRQVFYDIYSNLHYGYVGRGAGIDTPTLILGAKYAGGAGEHDDGDEITMRAGAALYDKYGHGLTAEQFHQAVGQTVDELETAQREGKDVPQIRHGG